MDCSTFALRFSTVCMSMNVSRLALLLLLFSCTRLSGQGFESVFPGLSGAELIDSVARNFRPDSVLGYGMARDTMFANVLAIDDDSLRCIYSGHTLYLDPTQDPTQFVFQNGGPNGINTEHSYPQSKGAADGNARSDMHHLYPTRVAVNEARGSLPFAEIPDQQTQKWFIGNQFFTSIPTLNIDGYSESRTDAFEPRESVKGDIARSIFYFYTMYRAQANAADPNFFEIQRPTLCQWAKQDPADSSELRKTWRIAPYQAGKPNPFVLDCTLAFRCWCPGETPNCLVNTDAPDAPFGGALRVWPNPAAEQLWMELGTASPATFRLIDLMGRTVMIQESTNGEGFFQLQNLPRGVYVVLATTHGAGARTLRQMVVYSGTQF
ncbi:MAG: endonuclease [Saprospiraceae bacterium]|nr:endonuclease [Saprospiraceae bacterium]